MSLRGTLRTFGRNHDHTTRSTRTIDGRRRSILQHIDTLDILGVEEVHRARHDTVDDVERVVRLGDRRLATDLHREATTSTRVRLGDIHTRNRALQSLLQTHRTASSDILGSYRAYRTGQVALLHHTVTNHNDIFNAGGILLERNLDRGLADNGYASLLHTDIRYKKYIVLGIGQVQRKRTIHTRAHAKGRAFNNHRSTDNGLAGCIFHNTFHGLSLSSEGETQPQHESQDKLECQVFHCKSF